MTEIHRRDRPRVDHYCRQKLADPDQVQDVASQVFLKGLEGVSRGRIEHVCPWIFAIAHNGRNVGADYGNSRIQGLGPDGNVLAVWTALDDGSSFQPFALAIGADGDLYALDATLGRIIRISIEDNLPD